ncbi:MAG: RNA methyltransferase [Bacteriovoracaceae bacterium]|nr:RNA methyltransferase [Bacteriovoracaceae bacterium]
MEKRLIEAEKFVFKGKDFSAETVTKKMETYLTESRKAKIEKVLNGRTCNVSVLVERIHDTGNIAAVMRSMENLGFQKIDIIESEKTKTSSRITIGADKWLSIRKWQETTPCVEQLKAEGYQIVCTALEADSVPMTEIDFTKPTVICLGNEKMGVSPELLKHADKNCIIPTVGFSQSFNISVAAAILLSYIHQQRAERMGQHGDLTTEEKEILRAHYYLKSSKNASRYFI